MSIRTAHAHPARPRGVGLCGSRRQVLCGVLFVCKPKENLFRTYDLGLQWLVCVFRHHVLFGVSVCWEAQAKGKLLPYLTLLYYS